MVIEGPTNAEVFVSYAGEILVPKLAPGDMVILDNLSSHKCPRALAMIEGAGAKVLFLPAYSPDLNPIEKMWSKVKEFLRASKARGAERLLQAIALALEKVTPEDAAGWFASCSYTIF